MKYGVILVEGQSELRFVKDILNEHLSPSGLYLKPVQQPGTVPFDKWNKDIKRYLGERGNHVVTTMLDFYRRPRDFPEPTVTETKPSLASRVESVESQWKEALDHSQFVPYISCQEFEALLFSSPEEISRVFIDKNIGDAVRKIKQQFPNPEEINDKTSPSMHILGLVASEYQKPLHGTVIARAIGLAHIREECPHFNDWVNTLEKLGAT